MAEETTPPPEPTSEPTQTRSTVNQKHLAELQKSEEVLETAKKVEYAPQLLTREITVAFLDNLRADIDLAESIITEATSKTVEKEAVSEDEAALRDELILQLRNIQKAAKQKALSTGENSWLAKYVVGEKFHTNRAMLEQTAASFLANAAGDNLPGINADAVQVVTDALANYKSIQTSQSTAQSGASTKRISLAALVKGIVTARRQIQYAADALWPHRDPANAPIRREFKLPVTRGLK